jgi:hypothetical protein
MSLVEKINNANALGRQNLGDKGVSVPETATTYEIMQNIANIIVGGGSGDIVSFTDITYNEDNTITLTDTDGYTHTMECGYTDGQITTVKFDGISVPLQYDEGKMIVGGVSVDVSNAPVSSGGGTEELEQLIDESGVLDTEGTVTEKVEQLIDLAEWENVWYKASENITNANNLFVGHTGKTIPRTNLISTTSMGMFLGENSPVEYIDYYLDTKVSKNFGYCFRYAKALKRIVGINTEKATSVLGMFFSCSALETIEKPLNFSNVTDMKNSFLGCVELKCVKFVKETIKISLQLGQCAKLTPTSIQSIIDGLATVTTAQTLTLNKAIVLTDEQKATINAKGWTLAQ